MAGLDIEAVLARDSPRLMALPGVVGVAVGDCGGEPCIKVLVVKKTPALTAKMPATLSGFPVAIEETGELRALDSP